MSEIKIVNPKTGEVLARITEEDTEITEAWKKAKEEPEEVKESDDRTDRTDIPAERN